MSQYFDLSIRRIEIKKPKRDEKKDSISFTVDM